MTKAELEMKLYAECVEYMGRLKKAVDRGMTNEERATMEAELAALKARTQAQDTING